MTFPGAGTQRRHPAKAPRGGALLPWPTGGQRSPSPGPWYPVLGVRPKDGSRGPECLVCVVYFRFPVVWLRLDYSVLTSQPDPHVKCGFGVLLFFSYPSCF